MKMCYSFLKDKHFSTSLIDTKVVLFLDFFFKSYSYFTPKECKADWPQQQEMWSEHETPSHQPQWPWANPQFLLSLSLHLTVGRFYVIAQGFKRGFHKSTSQTEMQTLILLLQMIDVEEN